jgi:phosphoribosylformylglycinamidine (FGAM) synthase-like enzyme
MAWRDDKARATLIREAAGTMQPGKTPRPWRICHAPTNPPVKGTAILQQVVAGVRDYGNRMGIPTVNGAVYFDERYLGNPLVYCGNGMRACATVFRE